MRGHILCNPRERRMIESPYDLDAVRALDDARLWQLLVLVDDFGWPVAKAWLAMCWRNDGIEGKNRNAAQQELDGTCNFGNRRGERAECDNQPRKRVLAFRSPAVNRRAVQ